MSIELTILIMFGSLLFVVLLGVPIGFALGSIAIGIISSYKARTLS